MGRGDDETVEVVSYGPVEAGGVRGTPVDVAAFEEEVVSAQRLAVSRLVQQYTRGRMEPAVVDATRKMTPEKRFNVSNLFEWIEGEPVDVVEALRAGRVRARVNAAMGTGKTTRLAPYIARELNCRVLLVGLNAHVLQQVGVYIDSAGIGRFRRHWATERVERVCCMTYFDFCGFMAVRARNDLFRYFDVILFDEAFVARADVYVAKRCFSVYASAEVSLLLCSATMRTDRAPEDVASSAMGSFKQVMGHLSVEEAIVTGKLVSDYLVDRTMVLVPGDQAVVDLQEHYEEYGVDTRALDSAASYEDIREVEAWLAGDSTSPRVVIAHADYGISYNFAVAYAIIWPLREAMVIEGQEARLVEEPMSAEMVAQAKARTGRRMVDGSGGVVCSERRGESVELYESEEMLAYVMLVAAYIRPIATGTWTKARRVFPEGLLPTTAHMLLKVCLPVEVSARFLASDGFFSAKYSKALMVFAQPDHFLQPSAECEPVAYGDWVDDERVVEGGGTRVARLPLHATGELQTVLHGVAAIADGEIEVARWRPTRVMALGDGSDSEEEDEDPRFPRRRSRLRRVVEAELPAHIDQVPLVTDWAFKQTSYATKQARRSGLVFNGDRFKEAMLGLEQLLDDYRVPAVEVEEVLESEAGAVMTVELPPKMGDVESPGGSVVCQIPAVVCEKLNMGQTLTPVEMMEVLQVARHQPERFVASRLFDGFSGPWQSILVSLLDERVIETVVRKGVATGAYTIVDCLRARFSVELASVLAQSNLFKRRYLKVFKVTPSVDSLMRAIRGGHFDGIAQTAGFIERVKRVKCWIDEALLRAECKNVYLPTYITRAQRALPLRGATPVGVLGSGMVRMPGSVAAKLDPQRARLERRFKRSVPGNW